MKTLVTGAAGFLGRAVVERLLVHGDINIRCFVRPNSNIAPLKEIHSRYPQAQLQYLDGNLASQQDARRAVDGVDTIYHLAAGMKGAPATIFFNTVVASKYLLNAIQEKKRRVVLVSSLGVYGTSLLRTKDRIEESAELDPRPEKRNVYFHAKIWQERLLREAAQQGALDLVVVRPGVLYGQGNPNYRFPSRIGIMVGRFLFVLANDNPLPLCHFMNCADAVVVAGQSALASGQTYNIVDDNLPTAKQYVREYKQQVRNNLTTITFPFALTSLLSRIIEKLNSITRGQIPAALTPYEAKAMWKGYQYDTRSIKQLGWNQIIPTDDAMSETFAYLRASLL